MRLIYERAPQLPPLRWRLAEVPLGLDHPYWVEEAEIDLGYHIREMALASPGNDAAARRPGRADHVAAAGPRAAAVGALRHRGP